VPSAKHSGSLIRGQASIAVLIEITEIPIT
jgi:hypothetical protein